jgi:ubiquinone/menaquinone biosynthesis C-methylase UbiE
MPIDYAGPEGDAYHRERHKEFIESAELSEAWAAYLQLTYFPKIASGAKFLEVGAGLGTNLLSLKNTVAVYAVEPSREARDRCAASGIHVVAELSDLPQGMRFDYVMLRHVLEHLPDPRKMLTEVQPLLAKGGQLFIALPVESPRAEPSANDIDHHLYSWNRQTISNLLKDCGYRVISARLNYRNGRRIFLPLYRWFGVRAYSLGLRTLGWLRRYCEIVVVADRPE